MASAYIVNEDRNYMKSLSRVRKCRALLRRSKALLDIGLEVITSPLMMQIMGT